MVALNDGGTQAPSLALQQGSNAKVFSKHATCREPESTENGQLLDLPLEIFNKIASYLLPADVLSLARSNKSIRNILMSRASRPLWQTVFRNIPYLPTCPESLCEPQYASLIFSETCSRCGAKVLDGPDPYLRVRLCKPCWKKEMYELDLNTHAHIVRLVPTAHAHWTAVYTLYSAFKYVKGYMSLSSVDRKAFEKWRVGRVKEMREWHQHGVQLELYLKQVESEKQQRLESLRKQHQDEVERRLISAGWTKSEILLRPHTSNRWQELVQQPELITDQNWGKIYPSLVLLLWSNRAYDRAVERKNRRLARVDRLYDLVTGFRQSLPPLFTVTPATHSNIPSSRRFAKRVNYRRTKIDMAFPAMAEIMGWPFIKDIIDKDTAMQVFEGAFMGLRHKFGQAVTEWRNQVDQDLLSIRSAGYDTGTDGSETSTNKNQGAKGKCTMRIGTRNPNRNFLGQGSSTAGPSSNRSAGSLGHTANISKAHCLTTPSLPKLPKTLQILLRADSRFMSDDRCQAYPYNIPTVIRNEPGIDFLSRDKYTHGDHWYASRAKWDDVGSAIARAIIHSLGLPHATSEEMDAFSGNFKCGRCETRPYSFEGILVHYRSEENDYQAVQEAKRRNKRLASIPYNHIHDVDSDGPPLAFLLTPQASADYMTKRVGFQSSRTLCELCQPFGERFTERYASIEGVELPHSRHLRDVHGKL